MSFSASEVAFLRRLISGSSESRRNEGNARRMSELHGIGKRLGSRVLYAQADFDRAQAALLSRGVALQSPSEPFRRSEAGGGLSEKAGARAVTEGLLAVVPIQMNIELPVGAAFAAVHWEEALSWGFDAVLECENLEPLMRLAEYSWLASYVKDRRVLAVYRGGPQLFTVAPAASFIRMADTPVFGFYDFDPAGLAMAAGEPRLEALCLPPMDKLEEKAKQLRRPDLFFPQLRACQSTLDGLRAGPVSEAWKLLKRLQWGLDQESFPR